MEPPSNSALVIQKEKEKLIEGMRNTIKTRHAQNM
jgi:hypothetical protein